MYYIKTRNNIKVEVVENLDFKDRKKLVEIKDKNLLLHINNMIPAFAKANLNVNNAVKLQEQGKKSYIKQFYQQEKNSVNRQKQKENKNDRKRQETSNHR